MLPEMPVQPDARPPESPTEAQLQLADALGVDPTEVGHAVRHLVEANADLAPLLDVPPETAAAWAVAYEPPTALLPPDRDALLQHLTQSRPADRPVAATLLHHVGPDGLLRTSLAAVARAACTTVDRVEPIRRRLRELEPVGTGCRTRAEQLELRVREAWPDDPCFPGLIRDRLRDLEAGLYAEVAAATQMEVEDVAEYARMLRALPPRPQLPPPRQGPPPGQRFALAADRSGRWRVAKVAGLADPLRRQIVDLAIYRQRACLDHGPDHLLPFALSDVARVLRRDLSTISRSMQGVTLHANGGELHLRALFALPMVSCDRTVAQLHSSLRKIIDQEDPQAPLADAAIADLLTQRGIAITRRSVQKHRERLRIPAARERRR